MIIKTFNTRFYVTSKEPPDLKTNNELGYFVWKSRKKRILDFVGCGYIREDSPVHQKSISGIYDFPVELDAEVIESMGMLQCPAPIGTIWIAVDDVYETFEDNNEGSISYNKMRLIYNAQSTVNLVGIWPNYDFSSIFLVTDTSIEVIIEGSKNLFLWEAPELITNIEVNEEEGIIKIEVYDYKKPFVINLAPKNTSCDEKTPILDGLLKVA